MVLRRRWRGDPADLAPGVRPDGCPAAAQRAGTRCSSRAALHFDVDTIDSNEIVLGLGAERDGLSGAQARRIVADLDAAVDVVGFTIAEFVPRQVIHLQQILKAFPLISGPDAGCLRTTAAKTPSAFPR